MDAFVLGVDHDHRRRGVVLHREIKHLGARLAWGHGAHTKVITAAPAPCSNHIPGGCFQAQLDAQLVGDGLGHIHVETIQLVLIVQKRERRIAFHQHVDHFLARLHSVQRGTCEGLSGGTQGDEAGAEQGKQAHGGT
ncbi:hypothetical protein D3C80_1304750 [compost metagenome]